MVIINDFLCGLGSTALQHIWPYLTSLHVLLIDHCIHFTITLPLFILKLCWRICPHSETLDDLRSVIDKSKGLKVSAVRPLILAAEENLHNMMVDLDKVVTKVRALIWTIYVTWQYRPRMLCWFEECAPRSSASRWSQSACFGLNPLNPFVSQD